MNPHFKKFWLNWAKPILGVLLVTSAIRSSLADWNDVPTGSMKPTILEGDRVLVNKLAFDLKVPFTTLRLAQWENPRRGDIVVFYSPHDGVRLVKRVIGLPGDKVAMQNNRLLVNGEAIHYEGLDQKVIGEIPLSDRPAHEFAQEGLAGHAHPVMTTPRNPAPRTFAPLTIPPGQYFMMGDNRDNSFDSRFYGCVAREKILGRVPAVVLSFNPAEHYLPRWHRFFTRLP